MLLGINGQFGPNESEETMTVTVIIANRAPAHTSPVVEIRFDGREGRSTILGYDKSHECALAIAHDYAREYDTENVVDLWDKPIAVREWLDLGKPCKHPPERLFSWFAGDVLCVGCCECGAVLAGGAS